MPKDVRMILVDSVIPGEPLTKVGVKPNFITVCATGAETNREMASKDCGLVLGSDDPTTELDRWQVMTH